MKSYNENIWDAAVSMYRELADERERERLGEDISELNSICFEGERKKALFCLKCMVNCLKVRKIKASIKMNVKDLQ